MCRYLSLRVLLLPNILDYDSREAVISGIISLVPPIYYCLELTNKRQERMQIILFWILFIVLSFEKDDVHTAACK